MAKGVLTPAAAAGSIRTPPVAAGSYAKVAVPGARTTMPEDITDSGLIIGCFQRKSGPKRGFADQHGHFVTITDPAVPA